MASLSLYSWGMERGNGLAESVLLLCDKDEDLLCLSLPDVFICSLNRLFLIIYLYQIINLNRLFLFR